MSRRVQVGLFSAAVAVALVSAAIAQPPPGPPPGLPPSPPIGPTSLEPNVARPGADYVEYQLPQPNVELCRSACDNDARCHAYTYAHPGMRGPNAVCWLKSAVPPPVTNTCCISGKR
jgi:hypothetical protein